MEEPLRARAIAFLERDRDHQINLLAALRAGLAEVMAATERGCLLRTAGEIYQLAAADEKTALELYALLPPEATMLEVQEKEQIELLAARFHPTCVELYYNVWYAGSSIALPSSEARLRPARAEDAPRMAHVYRLPGPSIDDEAATADYLAGRIATGTVLCAEVDGALAGFVGTHDEGSIGILTVLPAFRRRGLGRLLECAAIARALERGEIPFGQVAPDNRASIALQKRLGLRVAHAKVCWMEK